MPPLPPAILPALLLSRYLFFLTQRPISRSNTHYLQQRIHGLQSLAGVLANVDTPGTATAVALLRGLNPGNVRETAERLQLQLLPAARAELPPGYVVADTALPEDFLGAAGRVLLVFGPAIGIGDEIICFPLPSRVKAVNPAAEVVVLTAYEGLWDRVSGVDRHGCYRDHDHLLAALRGQDALGGFDVVVLVDFENPELYRAVTADGGIGRYAELSLGARVLAAVDNHDRWVYRPPQATGCSTNFYDTLDRLAWAMGLPAGEPAARFDTLTGRRPASDGAELVVYACPFTSKYDPSPRYWTRLLCSLLPAEPARPVRVVVDPGTNSSTRRFSAQLAQAAAAHHDGTAVTVEQATPDVRQRLSVRGVFAELDRADVVVCTDSFTAHAAPLFGCTTLVLARPGLENWRAPHPRSFHFDGDGPLADVVGGMRQVLGHHGVLRPQDRQVPPLGAPEQRLVAAGRDLARLLAGGHGGADGGDGSSGADVERVRAAYSCLAAARDAVVQRLPGWPADARGLLRDEAYEIPMRRLESERPVPRWARPAVLNHMEHHWLRWRNTNLHKYLELALGEAR